ncbi:polysaccharide biosynthesis protein [Glaciihabitans sp. GrIS 2.15]|uniref:polysaccharide biosynthesis protein n=1 Tax=Glaciihabitans sp. GrIS 2.15 TaxID=3071710 RepID=UPI002DFEBCFF|nr:FlaA1/EpsC-like NDP-sugar epimerase [Glaciihabitans sp. GrIS 2.15]
MSEDQPTRDPLKRVLIAGSGTAGISLATEVEAAGDLVVGFLDDAIIGPRILGPLADVATVCERDSIDVVYFAIPSAPADVLRKFVTDVPRPKVELAIIPRTYRMVSRERVSVGDLTDIDVLDMVGRAPVKHDMLDARSAIAGRRIMVTGAAGSIGSRLVAQLHMLEPEIVVCVDRSESGMFRLGQSLADIPNFRLEIGDVQSEQRIAQLMEKHRPEILFHVAAYKHVPLMQDNPVEAFNNNVWGTLNMVKQAKESGVDRVVYVSTDKAVNPTNVMGATKRIGELLLQDLSGPDTSTLFTAVRFGNVLESEGSVMQTFRRQLLQRRNLTVTDPEVTRYFMTIDEASQLVIQTATRGTQGDLFVLDMGEPIRVYDLAQGLIDAVNPSLGIDIVGLRPGEKMFEELSYATNTVDSTTHPKIFIVNEARMRDPGETLEWVEGLLTRSRDYSISDEDLTAEMRRFGFSAIQ